MSSCIKLEVQTEDQTPQKWCISLGEDAFKRFLSQGSPTVQKVFGEGSLFSPLLFGKFFDPSDAFPLWDFESDGLLSNLRQSGKGTVDWFQTEQAYVLKSALPDEVRHDESIERVRNKAKTPRVQSRRKLKSLFTFSRLTSDGLMTEAEVGKTNVQIHVEKGKIVEISGQLKQQRESKTKDWRSCNWWEYGYVRRLELPEDADWRRIEAYLSNDMVLEIKISRNPLHTDSPEAAVG